MNLLLIVSDTFRWDYLGCCGNEWIETPNLDRLASESAVYLDAFAEGLPTLPARRTLITGRPISPMKYIPQHSDLVQSPGWHPLYDEDITLAKWLKQQGYHTAMFSDVYHMFKPGKNFHRGFDKWEFIRGQEDDRYALRDKKAVMDLLRQTSADAEAMDPDHWVMQHLMNRKDWQSDADTCVAKTMTAAAQWLQDYSLDRPFFMWVDCFDPHEPWDPPAEDACRYYEDYEGLHGVFTPPTLDAGTDHVAECVLAAYAGEVTLVDRWVGSLLVTLEEQGYMDDTLVIFTSDHGTLLGEQGQLHKGGVLRNQCTQVPLIIRHPDGEAAGSKISGFVQHHDIFRTAMSMMDLEGPKRLMGRDAWNLATGERDTIRDSVLITWLGHCSIRTERWNLIAPMTTRWQASGTFELYDLHEDPEELENVVQKHPDIAAELAEAANEKLEALRRKTSGTIQGRRAGDELSVPINALGG